MFFGSVWNRVEGVGRLPMKHPNQRKHDHRAPVVAVTGGAASGKSAVCRHLAALNAFVIDLDDLSREAVAPGTAVLAAIVEQFGPEIVSPDGTLIRRKLRDIITRNRGARQQLEALIHPEIFRLMARDIKNAETGGEKMIVVEVPLLYETGMESLFDAVVAVTADAGVRIQRLVDRDGVTRDQAQALLDAQMDDAEKISRSRYVLTNNGSSEALIRDVERLYRDLEKLPMTQKKSKTA